MTHPPARVLLALTPLTAVLLLASCGAPAASPAAAPTVTVTATATATAAPAPTPTPTPTADSLTPDAAITAEQAWLLCYGATYGQYADTSTVYGYSDRSASGHSTVTANADGSFEVLVPFASKGDTPRGAEAICEASGTAGHPTLELRGGRDFG